MPGVLGVRRAGERPPDELALVVDRGRAQRQGVDPEAVAGVVGYALRGQALPRYYHDGREVPVRVRFEEPDRDLSELSGFEVPSAAAAGAARRADRSAPAARLPAHRAPQPAGRPAGDPGAAQGKEKEARERLAAIAAVLDLPEGVSLGADAERPTATRTWRACCSPAACRSSSSIC